MKGRPALAEAWSQSERGNSSCISSAHWVCLFWGRFWVVRRGRRRSRCGSVNCCRWRAPAHARPARAQGVELAVAKAHDAGQTIAGRPCAVLHVDSRDDADTVQAETVRLATVNRVVAMLADFDATLTSADPRRSILQRPRDRARRTTRPVRLGYGGLSGCAAGGARPAFGPLCLDGSQSATRRCPDR